MRFMSFATVGTMRFVVLGGVALCAMLQSVAAQDAGDDYVEPESYASAAESSDTSDNSSSNNGWAYDWSGSYIGVSAAYAMGSHDTLGVGGLDTGSQDLSGTALGGFVGQNYQLSRIVLGTEMDFSKSDISGSFDLPGSLVACTGAGFRCGTDVSWYGTFRGRAGVAIGDFLPYATAGFAVGGVNSSFNGPGLDANVSGLGVGWVLGAGLEYAVMKNLNVRAEALHFDLSDVSDTVLGTKVKTDSQFSVLRAGVSLKF
jgi:outer membrane immunogenic protein